MTASVLDKEKDLSRSASLASASDIELMLAFQQGNAKAFELLYRRHSNCLMTYLYRRTGDQQLSEEIFQETWLRISKASQSYKPAAQSAELSQASKQLLQCIGYLPEDQREVFLLREESGLSIPEIADLISLPLETVKSRLRYALNKLRQCLADYY